MLLLVATAGVIAVIGLLIGVGIKAAINAELIELPSGKKFAKTYAEDFDDEGDDDMLTESTALVGDSRPVQASADALDFDDDD
jgi:hypothetical protein